MKKQIFLFLGFIFIFANVAAAQQQQQHHRRTVTNADLEKFRQTRVQAEDDYRANYQRLGLPSPEEIDRQREQNRRDLSDLSMRLQRENFERAQRQRENEYMQAQIDYFRATAASQYNQAAVYGNGGYYSSGFYGGYPYYGYSGGNYNNYGKSFLFNRGGASRGTFGGNFYNPIAPGTPFLPGGVRINNSGLRINITSGGGGGVRFPVRGGIRR